VVTATNQISHIVHLPQEKRTSTLADSGAERIRTLVSLSQAGDTDAFGEIIALFEKRLLHFVLRMTRQVQDAEDITQETFVKAWKNLQRFRSEHAFSTWLFTIARRTALNHLRAAKPTQELEEHVDPVCETAADHSEQREQVESIWNVAKRLKPAQYEALWLRYGEGFNIVETATIMRTNAIRVRVLLHRARKRMAELLVKKEFQTGEFI